MKISKLLEALSTHERENLQQELANKDINSVHKDGKVVVHPNDHKEALKVAKRFGVEKHLVKNEKVTEGVKTKPTETIAESEDLQEDYNSNLAKALPDRIKRAEDFIKKISDCQKDVDEAKTYLPAIQKALKAYKGKGEFQCEDLTKAIQLLIFVERKM